MSSIKEALRKISFNLWPPLQWEWERTLNSKISVQLLEEMLRMRSDELQYMHQHAQKTENFEKCGDSPEGTRVQLINDSHADVFPDLFTIIPALEWPWASHLPGVPDDAQGAGLGGGAKLFEDDRLVRLLRKVDVRGKSVLDLGPLEAGHSYMLERAGANVDAVEGNLRAFLKCLIVKNLYNMKAKFLFGDFIKYLESPKTPEYDVTVASGVLYHMVDPLHFLETLSQKSDTVYFWTHYYNPERKNPAIQHVPETVSFKGKAIRFHLQEYGDTVRNANFWGGMRRVSRWMQRESILDALSMLKYDVEILNEDPEHPNGSAFCILAKRR